MASKNFTEQQVARYKRIFDLFDRNKDGWLEARELAAASQVLGYRMPKEQVMQLLIRLDLDQNGRLSFDEFLAAMPGNPHIANEEHWKAELRQKFQEYDADCNGLISQEEAFAVLSVELGFTMDKVHALITRFDVNEDGQLSYDEFVEFYLRVRQKQEDMVKAFKHFDRDNKGYVTADDAKGIMREFGFGDAETETLVKTHDTNQDGVLQYEEFVHFWSV